MCGSLSTTSPVSGWVSSRRICASTCRTYRSLRSLPRPRPTRTRIPCLAILLTRGPRTLGQGVARCPGRGRRGGGGTRSAQRATAGAGRLAGAAPARDRTAGPFRPGGTGSETPRMTPALRRAPSRRLGAPVAIPPVAAGHRRGGGTARPSASRPHPGGGAARTHPAHGGVGTAAPRLARGRQATRARLPVGGIARCLVARTGLAVAGGGIHRTPGRRRSLERGRGVRRRRGGGTAVQGRGRRGRLRRRGGGGNWEFKGVFLPVELGWFVQIERWQEHGK